LQAEPDIESADDDEVTMLDSITRAWSNTVNSIDLSGKLDRMQAAASEVIEHLVQLSVVFILQTGLLPVAFLWIFLEVLKWLFRSVGFKEIQNSK